MAESVEILGARLTLKRLTLADMHEKTAKLEKRIEEYEAEIEAANNAA